MKSAKGTRTKAWIDPRCGPKAQTRYMTLWVTIMQIVPKRELLLDDGSGGY